MLDFRVLESCFRGLVVLEHSRNAGQGKLASALRCVTLLMCGIVTLLYIYIYLLMERTEMECCWHLCFLNNHSMEEEKLAGLLDAPQRLFAKADTL